MGRQVSEFFLKSLLSMGMLVMAGIAMFTMFEALGRSEKRYNIEKLKKIHKANGAAYLIFFAVISYLCIDFIVKTKAEPSARAVFHSVFALTVITLLFLKISFVRIYRQFYGKVQTIGLIIAIATFGMVGTSGGYYLLITKFGREKAPDKTIEKQLKIAVKTDAESINRGKELYESKCYFCHDAYSYKKGVGPGHKGILKNPLLPVSKKAAITENVANQIRRPYKDMPSFSYLSDEQVEDIVAFLKTL